MSSKGHEVYATNQPRILKQTRFDPSIFLMDTSERNSHPAVLKFHSKTLPNAVDIVEKALLKYPVENLAVAFNGGKDCTVLLDLVVRGIRSKLTSSSKSPNILALYLRSRPQFPDMEEFIHEKTNEMSLDLCMYEGDDIKSSLWKFKEDHPHIEGIFMGTRVKDPSSHHLDAFSPTDSTWAPFMRILPILNFSYHEIFLYLKEFNVKYCKLYDQGYTSIGWEGNTFKNPKLKAVVDGGSAQYRPAFLLDDSDDERFGRE